MSLLVWLAIIFILTFGFVVFFGAPYVPTLRRQQEAALDMLNLKPGQTLLELGCGDGRMLLAAARRGIKSVGYELNPLLVLVAKILLWRHRHTAQVKWADFWVARWPETDGLYVFLHTRFMEKLDKKIMQNYAGKDIKVVSYAFPIPKQPIVCQKEGLFLYEYRNTKKL